MSEPAKELEILPDMEPVAESAPQGAWIVRDALMDEEPPPPAERPADAPVAAAPEAAPATPPYAPPPMGLNELVQQQARTNATLEQLAQMTAASMAAQMPRPEPPPLPDPIDNPVEFNKYMFDQQFAPLKQQIFTQGLNTRRAEMAQSFPDYPQVEPLVQQMSRSVPQDELLKPGTLELLYMAARGYMGLPTTQAHLAPDQPAPAKAAPPAQAQRWPGQAQPAPGVPAGTTSGPGKSTRMSPKFVEECRRMGNKPEDVIEFIKKEGGNPEEYM